VAHDERDVRIVLGMGVRECFTCVLPRISTQSPLRLSALRRGIK